MPEVLKKWPKTGRLLQPLIFKTMRSMFYVKLGIGNQSKVSREKVYSPQVQ